MLYCRHSCWDISISRWWQHFRWRWYLQQFFECLNSSFLHCQLFPFIRKEGYWRHQRAFCWGGKFLQSASTQQSREATAHQGLHTGSLFSSTVTGTGGEPCHFVWHSRYSQTSNCPNSVFDWTVKSEEFSNYWCVSGNVYAQTQATGYSQAAVAYGMAGAPAAVIPNGMMHGTQIVQVLLFFLVHLSLS